ncbi:MAG: prephenate dehydratase [Lachnospiraceae bacterium]
MDLLVLRDEIDDIDKQIVSLYERRMGVCKQVAEYKIETGKKVFDKTREQEKIEKVTSLVEDPFYKHGVEELFEQLMSMSRKMQYRLLAQQGVLAKLPFIAVDSLELDKARVVYQGAKGAYSHAAMHAYFGEDTNSLAVETFREAMEAIEEGCADYAVLPLENSTAGLVNGVYDLLTEFDNYVVGEQIIDIKHCLLGVKGTSIKDIESVYSHPQSLMQTEKYLRKHDWKQISMQNNAFAAQKIAQEGLSNQAAIASENAAHMYNLEVLDEGIQDIKGNSTKFIIVTNQKVFRKDAKKISICFEVAHESGSLYHMLSHFIYNNLNLTKIESIPLEGRNWEYKFFVDFDGNLADGAVKNALRGLREESRNMKILGNY